MDAGLKSCTNPACRFGVDGKCVEGLALDLCPHLKPLDVSEIDVAEEALPTPTLARYTPLATGEALDREDASTLQRRRRSRAIGLVAPNHAGKTSLIASVYELLQEGPVSTVSFAGSSTLVGFEKVCHDAREASRRGHPHTERTPRGAEVTFLHLDLKPEKEEVVSLFFGDRSGEDYLTVIDELANAEGFFEIPRSDTLTLLVNGDHLAGSEHRHEAKAMAPQLIDALVECGALREGARVAIVLTKQDLVLASQNADRVHREFSDLVEAIAKRHGNYLADVQSFVVAASPGEIDKVKRGFGVEALMLYWLQPSPPAKTLAAPLKQIAATRMFDQFAASKETSA